VIGKGNHQKIIESRRKANTLSLYSKGTGMMKRMDSEIESARKKSLRNVAHRMMILSGLLLLSGVLLLPVILVGLIHPFTNAYLVTLTAIALFVITQIGITKLKYDLDVKWRGIEASFTQYLRHTFSSVVFYYFIIALACLMLILQPLIEESPIVLLICIDGLSVSLLVLIVLSRKKGTRLPKGYRAMKPEHYPTLLKVIESTNIQFGSIGFLDQPGLKVVNAFQLGFGSNSIIALSDELENVLNEDEMTAIAAHELGHIYYGHFAKLLMASIVWPLLLINSCFAYLIFNFSSTLTDIQQVFALLGLFLLALGPPILLIPWLTRRWETKADLFAASLVGNEVIISALKKIVEHNIVYANIGKRLEFLISHPIIETRVKNISQLGSSSSK
jgi:Zn-dependent protease with chaperone function